MKQPKEDDVWSREAQTLNQRWIDLLESFFTELNCELHGLLQELKVFTFAVCVMFDTSSDNSIHLLRLQSV